MLSREKLEYQKRLRFLREAKAKTASEKLKLATKAEESDLTKRVETLGDEENRVPSRGETPKEYNEVPKTRETSRVKKPVEAGDEGDNVLDIDLSDIEYAKIAEGTQREEDAEQSLDRLRKRRKATRTKDLKRKSQANLDESNLSAVLKECGCQEKSPFDAPEEEHQGYMLVQSLDKLADQADELSGMAHHEDNPEPWVEFKVNAAAEQLDAVHDYITYGRKHRPDMEHHMGSEHVEELYERYKINKLINSLFEDTTGIVDPWAEQSTTQPQSGIGAAAVARPGRSRQFRNVQQLIDFLLLPTVSNGPTAHINWLATRPSNEQIANTRRYVGAAINNRIPQLQAMEGVAGNTGALGVITEITNVFQQAVGSLPATIPAGQQRQTLITTLRGYVQQLGELRTRLLQALQTTQEPPAPAPQAPSQTATQNSQQDSSSVPTQEYVRVINDSIRRTFQRVTWRYIQQYMQRAGTAYWTEENRSQVLRIIEDQARAAANTIISSNGLNQLPPSQKSDLVQNLRGILTNLNINQTATDTILDTGYMGLGGAPIDYRAYQARFTHRTLSLIVNLLSAAPNNQIESRENSQ